MRLRLVRSPSQKQNFDPFAKNCDFTDFDPEAETHDVEPEEGSNIDISAGREHYIDVGYSDP
jgi:hypothetical protein